MTAKIKLAACLPTEQFDELIERFQGIVKTRNEATYLMDDIIADLGLTLIDRAICEKDASDLQLLPYCVIQNEDDEVLTYDRPPTGDEENLHFFSSIGFGGHMDTLREGPAEDYPELYSIVDNAARELLEEVPFIGGKDEVADRITSITTDVVLNNQNSVLIRKKEGVDQFHLGLCLFFRFHSSQISLNKDNAEAANLRWLSLEELKDVNLESWSKSLVQHNLTDTPYITE